MRHLAQEWRAAKQVQLARMAGMNASLEHGTISTVMFKHCCCRAGLQLGVVQAELVGAHGGAGRIHRQLRLHGGLAAAADGLRLARGLHVRSLLREYCVPMLQCTAKLLSGCAAQGLDAKTYISRLSCIAVKYLP